MNADEARAELFTILREGDPMSTPHGDYYDVPRDIELRYYDGGAEINVPALVEKLVGLGWRRVPMTARGRFDVPPPWLIPVGREERILAHVEAQYADTRARLEGDPEWEALKAAAAHEQQHTPDVWLARNRLAIHLEVAMPPLFGDKNTKKTR